MQWWLRQVTSVVGDLDAALAELNTTLGLSVSRRGSGESAEAQGVDNAWLPLGATFLEVVEPVAVDAPAGRFHARYGDGGFLVILQTDDLARTRERLAKTATRVAWEIDEPGARELHLDHRDVGGSLLAIDEMDPADGWRWAGPDWARHVRTEAVTDILAATVHVPDPERIAQRWGELLDRVPVRSDDGFEIQLDRGLLRFERGTAHGRGRLVGVDVGAGPSPPVQTQLDLAGLRFRIVSGVDAAIGGA